MTQKREAAWQAHLRTKRNPRQARRSSFDAGFEAGMRIILAHGPDAGWADYFEHWGSTVGSPPFTQEAVVSALRGPKPFGTQCGSDCASS